MGWLHRVECASLVVPFHQCLSTGRRGVVHPRFLPFRWAVARAGPPSLPFLELDPLMWLRHPHADLLLLLHLNGARLLHARLLHETLLLRLLLLLLQKNQNQLMFI
jgi:hypothetical protein